MARQIVKKGLTAAEHAALDHSEIPGAGGEETFTQEVHDLEDHSSVPGVPSIEGLLDETAHDLLDHTGLTGIGSVASSWTSENNTVTASSEKDINITVESALVTRLLVSAIDGNATPDMDYDIEIYEDESMTTKAYIARGITDVEYEDKIPWEWFGGTTMYIKVINNKAADITDLDITINYRR